MYSETVWTYIYFLNGHCQNDIHVSTNINKLTIGNKSTVMNKSIKKTIEYPNLNTQYISLL